MSCGEPPFRWAAALGSTPNLCHPPRDWSFSETLGVRISVSKTQAECCVGCRPHARQRAWRVPGHPVWAVVAGHTPRGPTTTPENCFTVPGAGKARPHPGLQPKAEGTPGGGCLVKHTTRDGVPAPLGTPHKASGQPGWSPLPSGRGHSGRARPGLDSSHGSRAGSRLPPSALWGPGSAPYTESAVLATPVIPTHGGSAACRATGSRFPATLTLRSPQIHINPPTPAFRRAAASPPWDGLGSQSLAQARGGTRLSQQKDLLTSAGHWGLEGGGPQLRLLGERWSTQIHGARGTCRAFTVSRAETGWASITPGPHPGEVSVPWWHLQAAGGPARCPGALSPLQP